MNSLNLPVVHPAFQKLRHSGRMLHLAAGGLMLIHAVSHVSMPHSSFLYLGCLLLMALDIFILVFASNNLLLDYPRVNLFFRGVEVLFFLGIGITMLSDKHWILGSGHLLMSAAYMFLFYCEKNVNTEECVGIFHTGISVPGLPDSKFLIWSNINHIEAQYDSILINTSLNKSYYFQLQSNLAFEELAQIHEFCRHYLKTGVSS